MANRRQSEMAMRAALFNPAVSSTEMRDAMQSADPRPRPTHIQNARPSHGAGNAAHGTYTPPSAEPPASPPNHHQSIIHTAASSLSPDDYVHRPAYAERRFSPSQLGSISESAEAPSSQSKQNKVRKNLLGGFKRVANAVKSAASASSSNSTRTPEGLAKTRSISGHEHNRGDGAASQMRRGKPRPIVNHNPFAAVSEGFSFVPRLDGSQSARPQQQQFSIYPSSAQRPGAVPRHNMSMTSLDAYAQGGVGTGSGSGSGSGSGPGSASASPRSQKPGSRQRSLTQNSRTQSPRDIAQANYAGFACLSPPQGPLEHGAAQRLPSRKPASILVSNTSPSIGSTIGSSISGNNISSTINSNSMSSAHSISSLGVQKLPPAMSYDFGRMAGRHPMVSPVKPVSPLSPIVEPSKARLQRQPGLYPPTRARSMTIPSKDEANADADADDKAPRAPNRLPRKTSVPQTSGAQRIAFLLSDASDNSADDIINIPRFEPLMDGTIGRSAGELIHKQAVRNISATDLHATPQADSCSNGNGNGSGSGHIHSQPQSHQHGVYTHNVRSPLSLASSAGSLSRNTHSTASLASRSVASAASSEDLLTTVPLSRILYTAAAGASAPQPSSPASPSAVFGAADPPYQVTIDPHYLNMLDASEERLERELERELANGRKNRDSERIDIYEVLEQGPNGYVLAGRQQNASSGNSSRGDVSSVRKAPENDSGIRVDEQQKESATASLPPLDQLQRAAGSSLSIQTHGSVSESHMSMATSNEGFRPGSPTSPFSFSHSRFSLINQDGSLNLASFDFDQLDGYQQRLSSAGSAAGSPSSNTQRNEGISIVDRFTRRTTSHANDGLGGSWFWSALNSDSPPDRALSPPSALSSSSAEAHADSGSKQSRLVRKMRKQQQSEPVAASFSKYRAELGLGHDLESSSGNGDSQQPQVEQPGVNNRSLSIDTANSSSNTASHPAIATRTSESSIGSSNDTPGNARSNIANRRQLHPHYTSLHTAAAAHRGIQRAGDNASSIDSRAASTSASTSTPNQSFASVAPRGRFVITLPADAADANRARRRMRLMTLPRNYVPFDLVHRRSPASMSLEGALTLIDGSSTSDLPAGGAAPSSGTSAAAAVAAVASNHSSRHRSRLHRRSASALTTSELDEIMVRTVELCHSIQTAIKVQHSSDSGLAMWIHGVLRPPGTDKPSNHNGSSSSSSSSSRHGAEDAAAALDDVPASLSSVNRSFANIHRGSGGADGLDDADCDSRPLQSQPQCHPTNAGAATSETFDPPAPGSSLSPSPRQPLQNDADGSGYRGGPENIAFEEPAASNTRNNIIHRNSISISTSTNISISSSGSGSTSIVSQSILSRSAHNLDDDDDYDDDNDRLTTHTTGSRRNSNSSSTFSTHSRNRSRNCNRNSIGSANGVC
ncbi:hypothetical protein IWW48_000576 [Coemansia sp. RSA 1200]|nr:hypothetical protein IWW48_000576 [Coemansia sp. RSA 1200]